MVAANISPPPESISAFCRKWNLRELALFGSVLRPDFGPESDVDVLFTMMPGASYNWNALCDMTEELERLFGRPVDLIDREAIEQSRNWVRRREILSTHETIYAAR